MPRDFGDRVEEAATGAGKVVVGGVFGVLGVAAAATGGHEQGKECWQAARHFLGDGASDISRATN